MMLAQAMANQWVFGVALCTMVTTLATLYSQRTQTKAQNVKIAEVQATAKDIHILVNSRLGMVLGNYATTMAALAKATGDPEHVRLAALALTASADHASQQAAVDEGKR